MTQSRLPSPFEPIRLPSRPAEPARAGFPWIACLAPLVAAGLIWSITGSALVLVFAVLSPVIAVAGLIDNRRSSRRQRRRQDDVYASAMAEADAAVRDRLEQTRQAGWLATPAAATLLDPPDADTPWTDGPPPPVVLGSGSVPSGLRLEGAADTSDQRDLRRQAAVIPGAPITVDPGGGIGLVGPTLLARSLARGLVVQLVAQSSPRKLAVRLPRHPAWAWAAELPHTAATVPESFVTVTEAGLPGEDRPGPRVALAGTVADLPPGCATVVRLVGPGAAELLRAPGHAPGLTFRPHLVAERQTDGFPSRLLHQAHRVGLTGTASELPDRVSFTALSAPPDRQTSPDRPTSPDDVARPAGLACVVGVTIDGPLVLDLVSDGPHALVGGTTGSGKSELLVTWVAALGARYRPEDVTFLLVDFKGGAAFDPLRALPHCVGLITDLDDREAWRALASLAAELRHRERMLRDSGARDITDPRLAGRLARLVIVIDEFAHLLGAFPALHALFADIAARGRSLGVHLVLCTQRPAGVLRDALLANCSLRISLRVNNRADSQAVIGADAAAVIDPATPGRCIVSCGPDDRRTGQVATVDDADLQTIVAARRPETGAAPRRPWLDPLPSRLARRHVVELGGIPRPGSLLLGLVDQPDRQRYRSAGYLPDTDGHLLVVGGPRSGKSTVLSKLAAEAGARYVPGDIEGTWDALVHARADLDRPVPDSAESRLLLFDDVDAVLARWNDEHRAIAADLLIGVLRDGAAAGLRLVVSVQRLTGALQALPTLCQSRLVLGLPTVHDHQAAGEPAASWDATLPPGGGRWRGDRIQLVGPEDDQTYPSRSDRSPAEPTPSMFTAGHTHLVVCGSVARTMAALHAAGRTVVDLGAASTAAAGTRLEVSEVPEGAIVVGDADTWQAHWALLAALRSRADLVFDGCTLADYRMVSRRRDLPPPLAPAGGRGWLLRPDGTVQRVTVP